MASKAETEAEKFIAERIKRCEMWRKNLTQVAKLIQQMQLDLEFAEKAARAHKSRVGFRAID